MEFSKQTVKLILAGGRVINFKRSTETGLASILVRMPKNGFVTFNDTPFEYVECHNSIGSFNEVSPMTYRNGHVREVKQKFNESFYEELHHVKKEVRNQQGAQRL